MLGAPGVPRDTCRAPRQATRAVRGCRVQAPAEGERQAQGIHREADARSGDPSRRQEGVVQDVRPPGVRPQVGWIESRSVRIDGMRVQQVDRETVTKFLVFLTPYVLGALAGWTVGALIVD